MVKTDRWKKKLYIAYSVFKTYVGLGKKKKVIKSFKKEIEY